MNPELGHAEVKALLKEACDRMDPVNGQYDSITGHSPLYGFGRLNAVTAVTLASARLPDRAAAGPAPRRAHRGAVSRHGRSVRASASGSRDTGEKSKLTFSISGATSVSVFVRPLAHPENASFLTMVKKDGVLTGSIDVTPGGYEHTVVVQGGQPNGEAKLKLQRDQRTPVEIPITLDSNGTGGRVGTINVE